MQGRNTKTQHWFRQNFTSTWSYYRNCVHPRLHRGKLASREEEGSWGTLHNSAAAGLKLCTSTTRRTRVGMFSSKLREDPDTSTNAKSKPSIIIFSATSCYKLVTVLLMIQLSQEKSSLSLSWVPKPKLQTTVVAMWTDTFQQAAKNLRTTLGLQLKKLCEVFYFSPIWYAAASKETQNLLIKVSNKDSWDPSVKLILSLIHSFK